MHFSHLVICTLLTDKTFNYYTSVCIPPPRCLQIFAPSLSSTLLNASENLVTLVFVSSLVI